MLSINPVSRVYGQCNVPLSCLVHTFSVFDITLQLSMTELLLTIRIVAVVSMTTTSKKLKWNSDKNRMGHLACPSRRN
jgi:hypothetical protein